MSTGNLQFPNQTLAGKWQTLLDLLTEMGNAVVAFSGGVDSAVLAVAAHRALGDQMTAFNLRSPVHTSEDDRVVEEIAQTFGFPIEYGYMNDLETDHFAENPPDRCYHCKRSRFLALHKFAEEHGYTHVLDGSNADDQDDYRPGMRAIEETGTLSPLMAAGIVKAEVRQIAKVLNLQVWDRPSAPCLATRFPYGTTITAEGLEQVRQAEAYLKELGFTHLRVRSQDQRAQIEVHPEQIPALVARRDEIVARLKALGFVYVVVDLEGHRSGKMNEVLKK